MINILEINLKEGEYHHLFGQKAEFRIVLNGDISEIQKARSILQETLFKIIKENK